MQAWLTLPAIHIRKIKSLMQEKLQVASLCQSGNLDCLEFPMVHLVLVVLEVQVDLLTHRVLADMCILCLPVSL